MEADLHVHPGVDHAFFNDTRPEVYDAEEAQQGLGRDARHSSRRAAALSRRALPRARASARPPRRRPGRRLLRAARALPRPVRGRAGARAGGAGRRRPPPGRRPRRRRAARRRRSTTAPPARGCGPRSLGLHTTAERLAGEPIAFEDEIERCYGVRPQWVDEDDVRGRPPRPRRGRCPASGPLAERYIAWREAQAVPVEKLAAADRTRWPRTSASAPTASSACPTASTSTSTS